MNTNNLSKKQPGYGYYDNQRHQIEDHYQGFWYTEQKITQAIDRLKQQISVYDQARLNLESFGGSIYDLDLITDILNEKVKLDLGYQELTVELSNQSSINALFGHLPEYHLEIKRNSYGLPLYYLCRIKWNHWSNTAIIVHEKYISPGYKCYDERFVKLMRNGREVNVLCLGIFRTEIMLLLHNGKDHPGESCDIFLCNLGENIFRAAWHEDQIMSFLVAEQFDIPKFREAVELLYLALSGDFCRIRNYLNPEVLRFFEEIYGNKDMHRFLELIGSMDSDDFTNIPGKAIKLYAQLSAAFNQFLKTELSWGVIKTEVPLYKIILANYNQLPEIDLSRFDDQQLTEICHTLASRSEQVINELIGYIEGGCR